MTEMILPGVYIEVRAEGLIVPGRVTVGNLGVVGTASRGPIGVPVILGSYAEARDIFGPYDPFENPETAAMPLTLVRGLELAFAHGATTVFAVRVTDTIDAAANSGNLIDAWGRDTTARSASFALTSATGTSATLRAKTAGLWGNGLSVNVKPADEGAYIEDEKHDSTAPITLTRKPLVENPRNRVRRVSGGVTRSSKIIYAGGPDTLEVGKVQINLTSGEISFHPDDRLGPDEKIFVSYALPKASASTVTVRYGRAEESYTVADGNDLVEDIKSRSQLVEAVAGANAGEKPAETTPDKEFKPFTGGNNGLPSNTAGLGAAANLGLEILLSQNAHIIVAPGLDDSFGDELDAHCQNASTDALKRERIAVVGTAAGGVLTDSALVQRTQGHNLASDRVIYVGPGIKTTDAASRQSVVLPGSYAAAAVAGLLASLPAHVSPTNKTLRVEDLERRFTPPQLSQLVDGRVLAFEVRQGIRIVKGITTSTNTAWHQITTRRIVDFAKFGVRSAALPYIGLLNNDRVRGALRTTINSFLSEMVNDEMLTRYEVQVAATRDEERKGIARVTIMLRPVFSIDFIKVTMFLD